MKSLGGQNLNSSRVIVKGSIRKIVLSGKNPVGTPRKKNPYSDLRKQAMKNNMMKV
jgi:hypothetical protein